MPRKRVHKAPRRRAALREVTAGPAASSGDLLEACRRAVSRVLAELPPHERRVLEEHQARVVEGTHRDTRAALAELHGVLERVA